jgi:hypothetical protein
MAHLLQLNIPLTLKTNNMTAVEWLVEQLIPKAMVTYDTTTYNAIQKAKAMEKEQMEDCWIAAHQAGRFEGKGIAQEDWQTFFNYYNDTYGK